jgi:hypothetical protein
MVFQSGLYENYSEIQFKTLIPNVIMSIHEIQLITLKLALPLKENT